MTYTDKDVCPFCPSGPGCHAHGPGKALAKDVADLKKQYAELKAAFANTSGRNISMRYRIVMDEALLRECKALLKVWYLTKPKEPIGELIDKLESRLEDNRICKCGQKEGSVICRKLHGQSYRNT